MTPLTPARLAEIRAAAEAATPGPWRVVSGDVHCEDPMNSRLLDGYLLGTVRSQSVPTMLLESDTTFSSNAEFAALAREAVPELLAEVERLRNEIEGLRARKSYRGLEAQIVAAERLAHPTGHHPNNPVDDRCQECMSRGAGNADARACADPAHRRTT